MNVSDFLVHINERMKRLKIKASLVKGTGRVSIHVPFTKRVKMTKELCWSLGFHDADSFFVMDGSNSKGNFYEASLEPRLHWDRESMFIYCDLAKETFVGKSPRSLLGIATVFPDKEASQVYEPNHLHWYDVKLQHFTSIGFYIRDEHDREIPFDHGTTIITIHLRPKLNLKNAARIL